MNAQKLAKRIALAQLIEVDFEVLEPQHANPALDDVSVLFDCDLDPDLLVGDDDLDVLQAEAECAFLAENNAIRGSRSARRASRSW